MKLTFVRMPIMCLAFALLASLFCTNINLANAEAEDFKIGIVDISSVFEKYQKRIDLDQELKEQEKGFQDEVNKKRKEIIDLDEETQLLDLGSESRSSNENLLERKNVELEGYAKFAERQLLKKYKDFFENIYQEVVKKVEEIGIQEGFDLIIKKEESSAVREGTGRSGEVQRRNAQGLGEDNRGVKEFSKFVHDIFCRFFCIYF